MATATSKSTTEKATAPVTKTPAAETAAVDTAEAHTDRVAAVSRSKDGSADQAPDYEVIVPDDVKEVAENRPATEAPDS